VVRGPSNLTIPGRTLRTAGSDGTGGMVKAGERLNWWEGKGVEKVGRAL